MTQIRITLNKDDFRALVSGKEISFLERVAIKTRRFGFGPSSNNDAHLILEDMGWRDMAAIIEEVGREDSPTHRANLEILNCNSLWDFGADRQEKKPHYPNREFDVCECGDYRQDHDPDTDRCRKSHNRANGMRPCLAFKLVLVATEIPEAFRQR